MIKSNCFKMLFVAALLTASLTAEARTYNAGAVYQNPDAATTNGYRNNPCSDPWVSIALIMVHGRADAALCAVGLYNAGQWRDFNELVHSVERTRLSMQQNSLALRVMPVQGLGNKTAIAVFQGARMVAAGGGNMVAAGAGNMVAAGGGNVIVNNGGNLAVLSIVGNAGGNALPVARISSGYALKSGQGVALPKGSLVFE